VHPYENLTPDVILDAIDVSGHRCDGRLQALNSYENRVYQVGQDEGPPLIAKFYRPQRWSDAAILEEHALQQRAGSARDSGRCAHYRWQAA
jgi:Ser/Thr protein kinase RdoA (MazF antagonist)